MSELKAIFDEIDADGDDDVTLVEFQSAVERNSREEKREERREGGKTGGKRGGGRGRRR